MEISELMKIRLYLFVFIFIGFAMSVGGTFTHDVKVALAGLGLLTYCVICLMYEERKENY